MCGAITLNITICKWVSVCAYVYMCDIYVSQCVSEHACMRMWILMPCVCMHVHLCLCACECAHICVFVRLRVYTCVYCIYNTRIQVMYIHAYEYACMCVNVYMCAHKPMCVLCA